MNIYEKVSKALRDSGQVELAMEFDYTRKVTRRRVRLQLDYDLRYDQAWKYCDVAKGNDWTAFVNKARTLVHVMRDGHPSILVRIPRQNMKGWTDQAIRKHIEALMYEWED